MKIDLKNLPSESSVLHQIIANLVMENESLETKSKSLEEQKKLLEKDQKLLKERNILLEQELEALKEQLTLLKRGRFGKSSEKVKKQIEDLECLIEEKELAVRAFKEDTQVPKRQKLPEHLPRTDVVLEAPTVCDSCGGQEWRKISDDVSEVLEYVPSSFKVLRYIRPRCACTNCDNIVQSYPASKTIDKGKAGSGLLAHILIQKYCDHLPLYRQSQMYEREGVEIARSTMAGWAAGCARLLEPLVDELKKTIFASSHIHGDDTPIRVLSPKLGKTKTGRLWTYALDTRRYDDKTPPAVCYYYSPDRKGERPLGHTKDFKGVLHADAYSGYNDLYTKDEDGKTRITEAGCWAHTRRKFYEVTVASDNANFASMAVEEIGKIYAIEEEIRGLPPEKRLELRKERSKKLVDELFASLSKALKKLPPKSSTAKAINYAMNNKEALMRFLDDGSIEIDNNIAERAMRGIALGRKNWLFAGSDNGGHTAAAIYSLVETAKLNNVNPWKYLEKVLATIQDYNSTKLADLLPWNIKLV
jgi:transposase